MTKSKIDFRNLLIEALMIVFTVLLALALSEWRGDMKEDQARISVLNNIIRELESNKADVENKKDYHLKISQKLGDFLSSDSLWATLTYSSGMEAAMQIMERGILNPSIQSGAWRSAELSGIVNSFDYETLYFLSNVYRVQEEGVNSTWKKLAELFSDPDSYDRTSARKVCLMMQMGFAELHAQERSLVLSYENALEALKGSN